MYIFFHSSYMTNHPKLETLRLYPPIMALPKHTYSTPQALKVGDRTVIIPANTYTSPNILALQTHPKYWPEPLVWKPSRWISGSTGQEELVKPKNKAYYPWSDGPQNCPGVKFSQVEFVAVLALLMHSHSMVIAKEVSESEEEAKQRVKSVVDDCDMQILLRMKDSERVRLRCIRRS
jgi:cytochrome P450